MATKERMVATKERMKTMVRELRRLEQMRAMWEKGHGPHCIQMVLKVVDKNVAYKEQVETLRRENQALQKRLKLLEGKED